MTSSHEAANRPIDMSLRFWSDTVALEPVLREAKLHPDVLHVAGRPIGGVGRATSKRIAPRHFASALQESGSNTHDVDAWLSFALKKVEASPSLVDLLQDEIVEAVLWLAYLDELASPPTVAPNLLSRAGSVRVGLLIEDYFAASEISPTVEWLVPSLAMRA